MKRLILVGVAAVGTAVAAWGAAPQPPKRIFSETPEQTADRLGWWRQARFGMFIHFGLYAMPARHEWVRCYERTTNEEYDAKYFARFDPDLFDARDWARQARRAGMRYVVLTTKHHEGFCLWDTKTTDYKITKTPFGRDLVREFVDACRAEGLRVGFYFSIIDWHHPHYRIDTSHPLRPRDFTEENFAKLNAGRDMAKYREYMYAQVRELLTGYGRIDIIWFDFTVKHPKFGKTWKDWEAVELLKMTRELQPGIIVDNRLGLEETDDGWDFITPEQFKVPKWPTVRGRRVPWETCQTFSGSWGYHRDETAWKTSSQLIELLAETVSKGGNLILNVGPTARGEFDGRAQERLRAIGDWMHANARSIYGCTEPPKDIVAPANTLLTYNPKANRLYVHLLKYPMGRLPIAFRDRVAYAQFLHDGSELQICELKDWQKEMVEDVEDNGAIDLPVVPPQVEIPVIEVFLKDAVK